MTAFFLHGLESSSKGNKSQYFIKNFPEMIVADYQGSLENRLKTLEKLIDDRQDLTLIGSSYGGLMATCYALKKPTNITKLILLAPALNYNYQPPASTIDVPVTMYIGRNDTVTPPAKVIPLAQATFAHMKIIHSNDDHLLTTTFPSINWHKLL